MKIKFRRPKVRMHKDGSVTLSGLSYRDFTSIITSASLHQYDSEEKEEKKLAETEEQAKKYEAKGDKFMAETCRSNICVDNNWRIKMRMLIKAIDESNKEQLEAHNMRYQVRECGIGVSTVKTQKQHEKDRKKELLAWKKDKDYFDDLIERMVAKRRSDLAKEAKAKKPKATKGKGKSKGKK